MIKTGLFIINCNVLFEDYIVEILLNMGLHKNEIKYEKGDSCEIVIYVDTGDEEDQLNELQHKLDSLNENGILPERIVISWASLLDKDWMTYWKKDYTPIYIGNSFTIVPDFFNYKSKNEDEVIVYIHPQMAFGTGSHETTQLCLHYLIDIDVKDKVILDLGCGSGILGISALKKGASFSYLIDNDKEAMQNCDYNLKINSCEDNFATFRRSVLKNDEFIIDLINKSDIIFINILSNVIKEILNNYFPYLYPGKTIILSGLLYEEKKEIENLLNKLFKGYRIEFHSINQWIGYCIFT